MPQKRSESARERRKPLYKSDHRSLNQTGVHSIRRHHFGRKQMQPSYPWYPPGKRKDNCYKMSLALPRQRNGQRSVSGDLVTGLSGPAEGIVLWLSDSLSCRTVPKTRAHSQKSSELRCQSPEQLQPIRTSGTTSARKAR